MSLIDTQGITRFAFCLISILFAAYLCQMFRKDKDKRKLMVVGSFVFLAISSGVQVISSSFYLVSNISSLEFFPLSFAILLLLFSENKLFKKKVDISKIFFPFLITVTALVFVPVDLSELSTPIVEILGLVSLAVSSYLSLKDKKIGYVLISLSISSFLGYGLGWTYDLGLPFDFLSYAFGFIFIALAFRFASDDKSGLSSIFRIDDELDEAQRRLDELKIEYKTVYESVSDAILVIEAETNQIVDCNGEAEHLLGMSRGEIIGANQSSLFAEIEGNPLTLEVAEDHRVVETQIKAKNGEVKDVSVKIGVFCQGRKRFFVSVFRDISSEKAASAELQIAANLLGSASDSVLVHDLDGNIVYFNESAHKTRGYTKEEFQSLKIRDLEAASLPRFFGDRMRDLIENGEATFEAVNVRKDGSLFPIEIHAQIIESNGEKLILSVTRDISERKVAEEKLRLEEERSRTLLDSANVLVQSVDKDGKFVFVNHEWKKVLGYGDEEIGGLRIENIIRKDHLSFCLDIFRQVASGACIHDCETVFVGKDGQEIVVSGNACPVFRDERFVSTVAFFVDITERKRNEQKLLESARKIEMMNEKLRVVGGLTRHDVRNKLSAVTGYSYILKKKHRDLSDVVEVLGLMEKAVAESVKIFDFAKMYEELGTGELAYIDVESKVKEAHGLFSGSLPRILVECRGLRLLGDSFLRQLFYNFIDNTRKYGAKTSLIRIRCEMGQDCLRLIYEDDGIGIPMEKKAYLFKEGYSTGGSTGFGLFLIRRMMDVYGWVIEENGEPGKGARFTMTIPRLNSEGRENFRIEEGADVGVTVQAAARVLDANVENK